MKAPAILISLLLISFSSFGKKIYTMTKTDFVSQFNQTHTLQKVYCQNEDDKKVWLHCSKSTILILTSKDGNREQLMLQTIKYGNGVIDAVKYNVWLPSNKRDSFSLEEVESITVRCMFQEYEMPYFDLDNSVKISQYKNDSLKKVYSEGHAYVIYLVHKNNDKDDTTRIVENACYNLTFDDDRQTAYGVVQSITADSISISNYFNASMARQNKKEYTIYKSPIANIQKMQLLKSGGYSFGEIERPNFTISIQKVERRTSRLPYWFAINSTTGDVNLYRSWRTENGFRGVTEIDGRAIWYEGERFE